MIRAANSRRGMTLAELMVAMAMVAIMIVMCVSFVTLITGHTQTNGERLAFQQDFAVIKSAVEGWMTGKTALSCDGVSVTSDDSTLRFAFNALRVGENIHYTESVGAVTFDLIGEDEYLLFCTVTDRSGEMSYTFCVNPRVGETI